MHARILEDSTGGVLEPPGQVQREVLQGQGPPGEGGLQGWPRGPGRGARLHDQGPGGHGVRPQHAV